MKVAVCGVGQVSFDVLAAVAHGLAAVFPDTGCVVLQQTLDLPIHAYDRNRLQYNSSLILANVQSLAQNSADLERILGVIDVDIYAPGLNYVFGEAYVPGKSGLISLWRLRPQFHGEAPDAGLFVQRVVKEACHEVGHTLGLQHCPHSYCIMHFSNSIFEVDKKQSLFCDQCYLNAASAISSIGQQT